MIQRDKLQYKGSVLSLLVIPQSSTLTINHRNDTSSFRYECSLQPYRQCWNHGAEGVANSQSGTREDCANPKKKTTKTLRKRRCNNLQLHIQAHSFKFDGQGDRMTHLHRNQKFCTQNRLWLLHLQVTWLTLMLVHRKLLIIDVPTHRKQIDNHKKPMLFT